jgi:hypothetical protein
MLIDTRDPPPLPPDPDGPGRRRLNIPWGKLGPLYRMLGGLGLLVLSGVFPPVEAYFLILAACVLIGRGVGSLARQTGGLTGMKDHRQ